MRILYCYIYFYISYFYSFTWYWSFIQPLHFGSLSCYLLCGFRNPFLCLFFFQLSVCAQPLILSPLPHVQNLKLFSMDCKAFYVRSGRSLSWPVFFPLSQTSWMATCRPVPKYLPLDALPCLECSFLKLRHGSPLLPQDATVSCL
jgi:hypothetical protein